MKLKIGARKSPLSIAQVKEVTQLLKAYNNEIEFQLRTFLTTGDNDLKTSLKPMEKTNFFTKEIDEALILGEIDIGVHSAKDLPDSLPDDLTIYAITQGVDPRDSLVMYPPYTLKTLPPNAKIGISSIRREEGLRKLRSDFQFVDVRGTIQMRLDILKEKKVDAIVIAEAALIRLGLEHIHREILPFEPTPLQGKLAIVGKKNNPHLKELFVAVDIR